MKKLLVISLLSLSFSAYGGNNFNTLDAAPSVTVGSALPAGTNSIGQVTANAGTNLNTSALALDATVSAQSAKLPASLGAKTGATSLSVVPNTDTAFPVSAASLPLPTGAALDASITATTGTKAAGTAAASSVLGGGVYNSTLPSPTTGQQTALQVDATGRLRVNASEVASGASDSGNPLKVGGVYNSTPPTVTTGQRVDAQSDLRGSLRVNLTSTDGSGGSVISVQGADAVAGQTGLWVNNQGRVFNGSTWDRARGDTTGAYVVEQASATGGYSFSNLKANATTTVKSGAGKLHTISINTKGLTNTVTVYDNTAGSGTTIATLDTTLGQDTLTFDLAFATGLTVVIAGGTAADITITYK